MNSIIEKIKEKYKLSEMQSGQYTEYTKLLQEENKKYNLTRIQNTEDIFYYHIYDSINIDEYKLLENKKYILDIGSGAGIPGIILAIFYPEKKFYLMEVNKKKINFLLLIKQNLKINNIEIITEDFLSFIHKTNLKIDTFIQRACLPLKKIIKIYEYKKFYKSIIVYWAGSSWRESEKHNIALKQNNITIREYPYSIEKNQLKRNFSYVVINKIY